MKLESNFVLSRHKMSIGALDNILVDSLFSRLRSSYSNSQLQGCRDMFISTLRVVISQNPMHLSDLSFLVN